MSLFEERLADLPLRIEGYALERLQRDVSSAFTRVSTVIRMHGDGQEGLGEDVTYDAEDHDALQAAGAVLPLASEWTLGSFCDHVEGLELWPAPPRREPSRLYRVWAYESTALDLALRQAGTSLHAAVGREPRPARGGPVAPRGGRPRAAPGALRRLAAPGRAADPRPGGPAAGALPLAALQARPHQRVDARADRRARRHGGGGLRRLQGPLRRLDRRPARRSRPLPARGGGLPGGLDRGPQADRRDRRDPPRPPRAHHLGRADPRHRRHRGPPLPAPDGQRQALAPGTAALALRRLRVLR